jgi:phosphotransacetylase/acyl dehydratase
MDYIENRTFNEISIGDVASLTRVLTRDDILLFAAVSGDVNPAHVDEEFARSDIFQKIIAHGMWGASLISTVLGTVLPGPGAIYVGQTLQFRRPVAVGDTITVTVKAQEKHADKRRVIFDCQCTNQAGEVVIAGTAEVIAPAEKVKRPKMMLPEVQVHDQYARYRELMRLVEGLPPIRTAVVHPADDLSVVAALEAAKLGLIDPVLVGPEARIRAVAKANGREIDRYTIVPTRHSHEAAERAVAMARAAEVDALMKGSLATEELMAAVRAADTGLRTERQLSHAFALDVPHFPRPLFLTDAVVNVNPTLLDKRDIIQNSVELLHALGQDLPKVAILAAYERVEPHVRSTIEAAALCKMADRGQITGAVLDGPLAFDTATSAVAAQENAVESPVAGAADILLVPDLEVGQMLVQQLETLAGVRAAGLVLGARVPIVLSGPGDTEGTLTASCALAVLLAHAQKRRATIEKPVRAVPSP